jgi:hypothetical protein
MFHFAEIYIGVEKGKKCGKEISNLLFWMFVFECPLSSNVFLSAAILKIPWQSDVRKSQVQDEAPSISIFLTSDYSSFYAGFEFAVLLPGGRRF